MESENRKTILFAFAANPLIAVAKLAGGILTGSRALLAEAAHSIAEFLTMQVGPEDILVAARLEVEDEPSTTSVERVMDDLERDVRRAVPAVRQVFIEQPTCPSASVVAIESRRAGRAVRYGR
jgi:divalent metal cation (Fe/Co/Zn/Cd) transporter